MSSSFQLRSHPSRFLKDHLLGVAEASARLVDGLAQVLDENFQLNSSILRNVAYVIGVAHDIGKATQYFQDYLPPKNIKPKNQMLKAHSPLSAVYGHFAARRLFSDSKYGDLIPSYVSLAIQAHHGALENPITAATKNFEWQHTIATQLSRLERKEELDLVLQNAGLSLPSFSEFESQAKSEIPNLIRVYTTVGPKTAKSFGKELTPYFLLSLLLSILVDADRMDAAALPYPERRETSSSRVAMHISRLSRQSRLLKNASQNIADGRDELYEILSKKAEQVPLDKRIFTLTAPTGYGKTLAALHFALKLRERVARNGFTPRIIYVAPYLSILDQNFETIAEALGTSPEQSSALLLHHHLAEMQYQTSDYSRETFSSLDSELLIEGWNSEVIVTSFIQFFYALVGSKSSQLRKFHNLVGSIVVLDEVQTIKHEYWSLVRETLNFVADKLKMHVVLMTATQPLIFSRDETIELADTLSNEAWKTRVTIRRKLNKKVTLQQFVEEVNSLVDASRNKSILIVMNTIRSSIYVFNELQTSRKKYYLSASVVPAQRKERIDCIKQALLDREPIVAVTTQVVEAGVDLDFNTVIRDIGPVDSIIQVAGRCNRNGLREAGTSEVYIYSVVDERGTTYANRIYGNYLISKSEDVLRTLRTPDLSSMARDYYQAIREGSSQQESKKLLEALRTLDYERLDRFRLIDEQPGSSVYVEIDEKASRIWDRYVRILESEKTSLERKEEFLRMRADFYSYVINVSAWESTGLQESKGFFYIPNSEIRTFYDKDTGFAHETQSRSGKQAEARIY